jgi:periplasmic glucans biosynthesis protein
LNSQKIWLDGSLSASRLCRRKFLASASATVLLAMSGGVRAQDAASEAPSADNGLMPAADGSQPFSFDILTDEMRRKAGEEYSEPEKVGGFLSELNYDLYRLIRFNPSRARFADVQRTRFQLQAFHLGWLFANPITMMEVDGDRAKPMTFTTEDFLYQREAQGRLPANWELPGVAGFRLHSYLNRPDVLDELVAFQGASYFRALGRGSTYGLSARGLAINTGTSEPEEFPVFTKFYIERPSPTGETINVYALMDSPSLTGAYRFEITPGEATTMDVTARLFLRSDVRELGVAPLTSMYLYGERNREQFDDYRPRVHDSDGLLIENSEGGKLWRALANPSRLASSYFSETAPKSFGLYQREREFDHYQDASANYQHRPSLRVEPIGDWGKGMVRLVEIPSDLEINDNIVAFWIPEQGGKAGDALEFKYRLSWGDLPPEADSDLAYIVASRAGTGGVSGVDNKVDSRKFVVDFKGGPLTSLPASEGDHLKPVAAAVNGTIEHQTLTPIPEEGIWRFVMDVTAESGATVELTARLEGYEQKLTETWAYQWIKP